jgi:hypothetical protein
MKSRNIGIFLIVIAIVTISIFSFFKIKRFIEIDNCLDHGGNWNYQLNSCEFSVVESTLSIADTIEIQKPNGYNQLADEQNLRSYPISEYNTDLEEFDNIIRPKKSQVIKPVFDTKLLYKIWTLDPNGPHADFWLTEKDFYVVDYDGDGAMPYLIEQDSILIFYNDFIQKGRIMNVTRDSLVIQWEEIELPTSYVIWEN